jgi:hypothetical protein
MKKVEKKNKQTKPLRHYSQKPGENFAVFVFEDAAGRHRKWWDEPPAVCKQHSPGTAGTVQDRTGEIAKSARVQAPAFNLNTAGATTVGLLSGIRGEENTNQAGAGPACASHNTAFTF